MLDGSACLRLQTKIRVVLPCIVCAILSYGGHGRRCAMSIKSGSKYFADVLDSVVYSCDTRQGRWHPAVGLQCLLRCVEAGS